MRQSYSCRKWSSSSNMSTYSGSSGTSNLSDFHDTSYTRHIARRSLIYIVPKKDISQSLPRKRRETTDFSNLRFWYDDVVFQKHKYDQGVVTVHKNVSVANYLVCIKHLHGNSISPEW